MEFLKKFGLRLGDLIINPVSPIVIFFVGFLLTRMTDPKGRPGFITKMIDGVTPTIGFIFLVFWLVFSLAYAYYLGKKDQYESTIKSTKSEIIELENIIKEKERQIEYNSGIIMSKYSELSKFNKIQRFNSILKILVDNSPYIQTAQLYSVSQKLVKDLNIEYKINCITGYAYEGITINSMLQNYYTIPLDIYNRFEEIISLSYEFDTFETNSNDVLESIFDKLEEKTLNLSQEIKDRIQNYLDGSQNMVDGNQIADLFRVLLVIVNTVLPGEKKDACVINIEHEENVLKLKRTGILGSILLKNNYLFKHTGSSTKNGRTYFSYYFEIYGEQHIILLSIPLINNLNSDEDLVYNIFEEVINELDKLIEYEFKLNNRK